MDIIFDLEGDGFNPTKIHCFVYQHEGKTVALTSYKEIKDVIRKATRMIGHNITRFDIPVLERILKIKIKAELVDTLALSWYLYPKRIRHGLEDWGEDFGVEKPKIDDWENLSIEEYVHRCTEDVKINTHLWEKQWKHLNNLYEEEKDSIRLIRYLQFKMDCAREQERSRWKLDLDKATKGLEKLSKDKEGMVEALEAAMPEVPTKAKKKRPAKPFKQDGTWSVTGAKWFNLLKEHNLPQDYDGEIEVITGYKPPNADSHVQVKDWLFSLGWEPANFKYEKEDDGSERAIPQVRIDGSDGKELCPSVMLLAQKNPSILHLEKVTVLSHRISILKGFIENVDEEGYVKAKISGLTNTLRFKHKEIVNLPGVDKPYGEDVRGCLIAPKGYELCGSDMSSLEDRTKQHYMWKHDPDYVKEMQKPDFDPHLDIAVEAKFLTPQQVEAHKKGTENHGPVRKKAKVANYACTYGAGAPTIARTAGIKLSEAKTLVKAYRDRNWALEAIAEEQVIQNYKGQMWLYNPVSRFWYSLRHEKDIFSTLNQGTGVYCFDAWGREFMKKRKEVTAQFHDEYVLTIKKGHRDQCKKLLREAIDSCNKLLKLNRELDIDIQFGNRYSEIH